MSVHTFKRLGCISAYLVVEVREEEEEGGHVDDQHVLHPHREVTANPEHCHMSIKQQQEDWLKENLTEMLVEEIWPPSFPD